MAATSAEKTPATDFMARGGESEKQRIPDHQTPNNNFVMETGGKQFSDLGDKKYDETKFNVEGGDSVDQNDDEDLSLWNNKDGENR